MGLRMQLASAITSTTRNAFGAGRIIKALSRLAIRAVLAVILFAVALSGLVVFSLAARYWDWRVAAEG